MIDLVQVRGVAASSVHGRGSLVAVYPAQVESCPLIQSIAMEGMELI